MRRKPELSADSACIDQGDNTVVTVTTDLDGTPRIADRDYDGTTTVDNGGSAIGPPAKRSAVPVARLTTEKRSYVAIWMIDASAESGHRGLRDSRRELDFPLAWRPASRLCSRLPRR